MTLIADERLDATGRRLAQLVFWVPALQLLLGNLQIPGPGFVAPALAAYLLRRTFARAEDRAQPTAETALASSP